MRKGDIATCLSIILFKFYSRAIWENELHFRFKDFFSTLFGKEACVCLNNAVAVRLWKKESQQQQSGKRVFFIHAREVATINLDFFMTTAVGPMMTKKTFFLKKIISRYVAKGKKPLLHNASYHPLFPSTVSPSELFESKKEEAVTLTFPIFHIQKGDNGTTFFVS